jgi:hypothetical protein
MDSAQTNIVALDVLLRAVKVFGERVGSDAGPQLSGFFSWESLFV